MADKIEISIDDKAVINKLNEITAKAAGLKPALEVIGASFKGRIGMAFKRGTSPYGEKWAPLVFRKGQPLRDTGILKNSITSEATNKELRVGTNQPYAKTHQFGAEIHAKNAPYLVFMTPRGLVKVKSVTIPARPFLPIEGGAVSLPKAWSDSALNAIKNHLGV